MDSLNRRLTGSRDRHLRVKYFDPAADPVPEPHGYCRQACRDGVLSCSRPRKDAKRRKAGRRTSGAASWRYEAVQLRSWRATQRRPHAGYSTGHAL